MVEKGVVLKSDESGVDIQMHVGKSCESCQACFIDADHMKVLHIRGRSAVRPGQLVEVEVRPGHAIRSALFVFLFPLIFLVTGYFCFEKFINIPFLNGIYEGILGAIAGLVFSYAAIFFYDRSLSRKESSNDQIRIIRTINMQD